MNQPRGACGVGVLVDLNGEKTHELIAQSLFLLHRLDHRGARGSEEKTGDGTGILLQKPDEFFRKLWPDLPDFDQYGVGQIFAPRDLWKKLAIQDLIGDACRERGFRLLNWREVPTDNSDLGKTALLSEPAVLQFFVQPSAKASAEELDRRLYVLRRIIENRAANSSANELFHVCSLDRRTIVYKGLLTCDQLRLYYPDLSDPDLKSGLSLVHSRFSTNTLGAWNLAHPYRRVVHNGEINTLRGNLNRMKTREALLEHPRFGADIEHLKPITSEGLSDTAVFDNVLELLLESGRSLPHALRMLIPEAWHKAPEMDEARQAFYDFASTLMEPWDGPALVAATDGYRVAAILDRNGLRPCRYCLTKSNLLIMASEAGVLDTLPADIREQGRLQPGELFLADTLEKRVVPQSELFEKLTQPPYANWLSQSRVRLNDLPEAPETATRLPVDLISCQRAFGYTIEALRSLVQPMSEQGKDPTGSMGNDSPLAVFSERHRSLFHFFVQQFAQVSNPPLDYLREDLVTSLSAHIGRQHNVLEESAAHCRQLLLPSPILTSEDFAKIAALNQNGIRSRIIDLTFPAQQPLPAALEALRETARQTILDGIEILILSDRSIREERIAIPSLLATGALHQYLIRSGLRPLAALVLDSGEPHIVHHFCCLLGFGADAIHPWLGYASVEAQAKSGWSTSQKPVEQYRTAVETGLLKVMSKMGISTIDSYKCAQIFQAVGLDQDLVDDCFSGTSNHLSGFSLVNLEKLWRQQHELAFSGKLAGSLPLDAGGDFYWRRDGELHQWNPYTVGKLQQAARYGLLESYREFAALINDQDTHTETIRGLLEFREAEPVSVDEVEDEATILRRFSTGSMSLGALSTEAHETLAIAMNRIGGKSGTGEGGEQVERFGTEKECSMKQVASGRFGVTIHYLANAKQIEIKMAQGAKPGEGGELPGPKVNEEIAAVRFTTAGVGLISPPPHHDIYSIEDLAQLIHDLKCANPEAEIHVKLVATAGVGTIAAGVAKARADAVLIAGDSGGTGAATKTSIKFAGVPWELGLAETQQVLLANNLRSRICVRVDGGFKTGRDVVIAALLGAEEFGFGTAPLVALGCIMLRKCHCNTCSVGIATQDPLLRARFAGQPEHVIQYLRFVAQETREIMARLGFRTMNEMIGRVDRLKPRELAGKLPIDLSTLLRRQPSEDQPRKRTEQNHRLAQKLDHRLIDLARPGWEKGDSVRVALKITNADRTFSTLLSSKIAKIHGPNGLPDDLIQVDLHGSAGQSFGAFLVRGVSLHLVGDANDYVGKGLSGGKISISTPPDAGFVASANIIAGNVALYGATSGEVYLNGMAGERFAVRNSGALAVVEGIGDHGCEYMTGGSIVILGQIGRNFGAGMSGGEAYLFLDDPAQLQRLNLGLIQRETLSDERDIALVSRLLENHVANTSSSRAKKILANSADAFRHCVKIIPGAYSDVLKSKLSRGEDLRIRIPPKASPRIAA